MSSTAKVCQVIPSSLEPSLVEPLVSMFQLAPSSPDISIPRTQMPSLCSEENSHVILNNNPNEKSQINSKLGGWNSIESLSNSSYASENVYVHPLDKRSSCAMSTKSLEMCTESLGCETGSKINGGMDEFTSLLSMERQNPSGTRSPKTRETSKKMSKANSFPPPLTSITGSNGVRVSTHREGGRLVIKAVNSSSCNVHFQTERENGRLRLSLPKEDYWHFNKHMEDENEQENVHDEKGTRTTKKSMHMKLITSHMIITMAKEKMNLISMADFGGKIKLGVKLEVQSGAGAGAGAAAGARTIARGCQVCIFVWLFPKSFLLELAALEIGPK